MSDTPTPDADPQAGAPAAPWAQTLLRAECLWMQPRLRQLERVLWLSPVPVAAGDQLGPDTLSVFAAGSGMEGDLRAAIAHWPLPDDCLDGVVVQHALEVGLDLDTLIAEAIRVLKPECSLWVLASGTASLSRFRLSNAMGAGVRWPSAFRPGAFQALMSRSGCVDVECTSLAFDSRLATLGVMAHTLPWSSVVVGHARKRRSANILRPRALRSFATARLPGMPALPASRVGLAA
ncbi:MAG: methyltransferase domain-containing protein [Pseudomonadota bacterium]|nr:methyltransferase domain-containing protein [Pseudomonadota bacterium]